MRVLDALSQAWTSAEASLPHRCRIAGSSAAFIGFDDLWIGPAEGRAFEDYASGSGLCAEQAVRRLSDRLREWRGPTTGYRLASTRVARIVAC